GQKEAVKAAEEVAKPLVDELFKGLIRTVKTGEFDIAAAVRGPNKDGAFAIAVGIAFEDPSALEKEFKKYVEKEVPEDERKRITWGEPKAGKVAVHTYAPAPEQLARAGEFLGGEKCRVAFAFAPHGVIVIVGPDAAEAVAAAAVAKPAESPVFDIMLNPARL